jgi:hypothetical protein
LSGGKNVAIQFTCTCGKKLQIKDEFAGQEGVCPACGQTLHIPAHDGAPVAVPRSGPPPLPAGKPPPLPPTLPPPLPRRGPYDAQDSWTPPPDLPNHGNGPLDPRSDFFVGPPPEIGQVTSAHSTLRHGVEPISQGARLGIAFGAAGAGSVIGLLIVVLASVRNPFWIVFWPLLLGGIGLAIGLLSTGFKHTCSYVGFNGVARFVCSSDRDRLSTEEVFLFRDATELRTSQTLHYTNGVYQNTSYRYQWSDVSGRVCYLISGSHGSEKNTPALTDPFYFALAAEAAWTGYLWSQVQAQLTLGGTVVFGLSGNDWVRVGPGYLQFNLKGERSRCEAQDIAAARIHQGMFTIKRIDAEEGWFSSTGVYKFPYNSLANAQLFIFLLDRVAGIRLS